MSDETKPLTDVVPPAEVPKPEPGAGRLLAIQDKGIVLRNMEDLLRFARLVVEGGAAPEWAFGNKDGDFKRATGAVAIAIQAGLEHGLGLLGGLQAFVVLDGHVTWRAEAAAAKIRNSPVCRPGSLQFWCEGEGEMRKGVATAWRVGDPELTRVEFTFVDARTAKLLGKFNWTNYPKRMFQWRALSNLAKDKFSDVLGGFPLADEVEDYEAPARTVQTPAARAALPAPSAPDPLMVELGVLGAKTVVPELVPADAPPFASHAEADAALAAAEAEQE
jgi:hypothetical protein